MTPPFHSLRRDGLLYRSLSPLRERREDIPILVEYRLDRHNRRYRQKKQFSREAMRRILEYSWPGNVRELENAVERAFVLSGGNVIKNTDLPPEILSPSALLSMTSGGKAEPVQLSAADACKITIPSEGLNLDACLHDLEKACYEEAIRCKDGNREAAARLLGVRPHAFRKRAKVKLGM